MEFTTDDKQLLADLRRDMWIGNGKKGMTTRMQSAEEALEDHEAKIAAHDGRLAPLEKESQQRAGRMQLLHWLMGIATLAGLYGGGVVTYLLTKQPPSAQDIQQIIRREIQSQRENQNGQNYRRGEDGNVHRQEYDGHERRHPGESADLPGGVDPR